jgi:hypothetical protein
MATALLSHKEVSAFGRKRGQNTRKPLSFPKVLNPTNQVSAFGRKVSTFGKVSAFGKLRGNGSDRAGRKPSRAPTR